MDFHCWIDKPDPGQKPDWTYTEAFFTTRDCAPWAAEQFAEYAHKSMVVRACGDSWSVWVQPMDDSSPVAEYRIEVESMPSFSASKVEI